MTYDDYKLATPPEYEEDRDSFVNILASTVPSDLDIGDERELLLHLHRCRLSAKECIDLVDDVADEVRARRINELGATP